MQLETLDATIRDYIKEMESDYEKRFQELETKIKETEWKYLEIKERYDILMYKKFGRSAEQILAGEKQLPLFTIEAEPQEEDTETKQEDY